MDPVKPRVLINGAEDQHLAAGDRGFQYGDGVFETIPVKNGIPLFLSDHLARLRLGCTRLGISPQNDFVLMAEIDRLTQATRDAVIKIIVTRGCGGRGYQPVENSVPTRVISLHSAPNYPETFEQSGVIVKICRTRLGINHALAGIKHLNRLEQILACRELIGDDFQEGLMLDQNENVIEGTKSNLFIVSRGDLLTPKIDQCGVAGIIRSLVIRAAIDLGLRVEQTRVGIADVLNADELFLTNSIMIVWPVKRIDNRRFDVGTITRRIQSWLSKKIEMEFK